MARMTHGEIKMVYEHHNYTKEDIVIQLHDVARAVEKEIGEGKISKELRRTADKISDLIKVHRNE